MKNINSDTVKDYISSLEEEIKDRDDTIGKLEEQIDDLREDQEDINSLLKEKQQEIETYSNYQIN